jgi:hypothetical protein
MANFISTENEIIPQGITETSTTQNLPLGKIIFAVDKDTTAYGVGEFIYLKGVASTAIGEPVIYDLDAGTTTRAVATTSRGNVAIAMSANVANQYGWYQIAGTAVTKTGTVAANGRPYVTATAGTLDDAVVAGDAIDNARFITANGTPSAGFALMQINRPSLNGNG